MVDKNKNGKIFRRGFGLKEAVSDTLTATYSSEIVEKLRRNDHQLQVGRITVHMAREFGFCYGVDRAIEYAYQAREQFPDKRIFLTGELIHNPHVNEKMLQMGIEFLSGTYADSADPKLSPEDVIILPAFGVSIAELERFKSKGCILVDTTCGSVLNVWKRVQQYARDGFTSIIHGKWNHEETRATSSQTQKFAESHYIVVLDMKEAEMVCDYVAGRGEKAAFLHYFRNAISPGFDPDKHLVKLGCANQTTMLSGESLAIAGRIRQTIVQRYGEDQAESYFRTFDTICSATQDRQDAVEAILREVPIEVMLVIGGYNSSNTTHLVEISGQKTHAYHIDDAACLLSLDKIRHKPVAAKVPLISDGWLPPGNVIVGITAGASTPNNKIGEVVARLAALQNMSLDSVRINADVD